MSRVAIATCRQLPEPDPDAPLLAEALAEAGVDTEWVAWEDGDAFDAFDLVVIRSTWNYISHLPKYLAWATQTARDGRLLNPLSVVRWNVDKHYLADLDALGVSIVPTRFLEPGGEVNLRWLMEVEGWTEAVFKPVISAGSFETHRFHIDAIDEGRVRKLVGERAMMVQPYMEEVETYGERAIVVIDGEITHAVRKSPRFDGDHESISEALEVSDVEAALVHAALATVPEPLLYARVDVVPDATGRLRVMELELVEPSLFLAQHPPALERLVAAIQQRLESR